MTSRTVTRPAAVAPSKADELSAIQNFASNHPGGYLSDLLTPAMLDWFRSCVADDRPTDLYHEYMAALGRVESEQEANRLKLRTIADLERNLGLSTSETIRAQNEGDTARKALEAQLVTVEDALTDERQKVADLTAALEDARALCSSAWYEGRDITPSELRERLTR